MKKLFSLLIIATISTTSYSQTSNIQWQKTFGGSLPDEAYHIQQTTDGGYVVAGVSQSNDGQVTGNHGGDDYWVVKLNDTGAIQWEKSFGGSGDDICYSIQQTADGGYILAGGTASSDSDVICSVPEWDYWLVKISSSGSIEWSSCFGGSSYNVAWSVQQTNDLNYIVTGVTYSNDGNVTGNHGGADYWVVLVSSSGSLMWEKCLGGSGNDLGKMVRPTTDGGYIAVGSSNSNDSQVSGNHGSYDYWVVKLDDTGAIQWQKSLGGSLNDNAAAIQQTYDGGYIVAGSSNSTFGQITGHHGDSTTADYWVVKLNDTGAIQWQKSLGGSNNDNAYSVLQTLDSGYIVSGSSSSADGDVTVNYGGQDYWVVKLSKSGTIQWQKTLGGSGDDVAYYAQETADSGYVVTGTTNSTDDNITVNHGDYDYWVVKLSSCVLDSPTIIATGFLLSTSVSYNTYQWEFNGVPIAGATNATYTATSNGTYNVIVTDTNGCKGTSVASNITALSVDQLLYKNAITILPNPTTGIINIIGSGVESIHIYNDIGQLMKEVSNARKISISELPAGLYFILLTNDKDQAIYQGKVIKE